MKFLVKEINQFMISEKQIITKTKIQNKNGLNIFNTLNNILNVRGISIEIKDFQNFKKIKLSDKSGFQYILLNEINEFIILPNDNLDNLILESKSEIDNCSNENELIDLLIRKM